MCHNILERLLAHCKWRNSTGPLHQPHSECRNVPFQHNNAPSLQSEWWVPAWEMQYHIECPLAQSRQLLSTRLGRSCILCTAYPMQQCRLPSTHSRDMECLGTQRRYLLVMRRRSRWNSPGKQMYRLVVSPLLWICLQHSPGIQHCSRRLQSIFQPGRSRRHRTQHRRCRTRRGRRCMRHYDQHRHTRDPQCTECMTLEHRPAASNQQGRLSSRPRPASRCNTQQGSFDTACSRVCCMESLCVVLRHMFRSCRILCFARQCNPKSRTECPRTHDTRSTGCRESMLRRTLSCRRCTLRLQLWCMPCSGFLHPSTRRMRCSCHCQGPLRSVQLRRECRQCLHSHCMMPSSIGL